MKIELEARSLVDQRSVGNAGEGMPDNDRFPVNVAQILPRIRREGPVHSQTRRQWWRLCQHAGNGLLHHRDYIFDLRATHVKPEKGYTARVFECSNDIVFIVRCSAAPRIVKIDDDRKGWPDTQILLDRG
jgi:hypothetical protein